MLVMDRLMLELGSYSFGGFSSYALHWWPLQIQCLRLCKNQLHFVVTTDSIGEARFRFVLMVTFKRTFLARRNITSVPI